MAKLGWIGIGDIGLPMALRLTNTENELFFWGRSPEKLAPVLSAGGKQASSPAELAATCDAVFLCITDTRAVEQVVFGAQGIASGATAGKILVDHSTIHPLRCREMAQRLSDETGMTWLDAPVSGGRVGAEDGTLAVMVGGDKAALERSRGWISAYAARITHVGPTGSGLIAKTCNQVVLCSTMAAWAEVLNYAHRNGADLEKVLEALDGSWSDSPIRRIHAPQMIRGQFDPGDASIMLKDMDIVGDLAQTTKSSMPMAATVTNLFRLQIAMGFNDAGPPGLSQIYHQGAYPKSSTDKG